MEQLQLLIRQWAEQLAASLEKVEKIASKPRYRFQSEVAKLSLFDRDPEKIMGFVIACKLYIRIRMREKLVEELVYWILIYIQKGSVDVWKKNILADLEWRDWEFISAGKLLAALKRKFGERDNKSVKVAELKQLE